MSKFKKEIVIVTSAAAVFLLLFIFFSQGAVLEFDPDKGKDVTTEAAETVETDEMSEEETRYREFMTHYAKELQEISDEFDRTFDLEQQEAFEAQQYGIYDDERTENHVRLMYLNGKLEKLTVPADLQAEHEEMLNDSIDLWSSLAFLAGNAFDTDLNVNFYYEDVARIQFEFQELITRFSE